MEQLDRNEVIFKETKSVELLPIFCVIFFFFCFVIFVSVSLLCSCHSNEIASNRLHILTICQMKKIEFV